MHCRFSFSKSGIYHVPEYADHEMCVTYIRNLPINAQPEVFGLHENADIAKDTNETTQVRKAPQELKLPILLIHS